MTRARREYHERLFLLEDRLLLMGSRVVDMAGEAMVAVVTRDEPRAAAVVRDDDRLDEDHQAVQEETLTILALQAPVATELRLISACMLVNGHLERMGDLCVNIARSVELTRGSAGDASMLTQIDDMGQRARRLMRRSLEAFARRDAGTAAGLARLDEPIDRLNRRLFRRLVEVAASDSALLDWAMRMVLVVRCLERLGDHAVDIGKHTLLVSPGRLETSRVLPSASSS